MNVSESIDHIRKLSPKLNKATDTAKAVMQAAENFLEECGVGIPVDVFVDSTDFVAQYVGPADATGSMTDQRYEAEVTYLSYRRCEGKYRFVVLTRTESARPDQFGKFVELHRVEKERVTPWSSSPRDEKLATFAKLADLLQEIAQQATKSLEAVEKSGDESVAIMKALTEAKRDWKTWLIDESAKSNPNGALIDWTDLHLGFIETNEVGRSYIHRTTGKIVHLLDPATTSISQEAAKKQKVSGPEWVKIPKYQWALQNHDQEHEELAERKLEFVRGLGLRIGK